MNKIALFILLLLGCLSSYAQSPKVELYTLIKQLLADSTGYENVGDWAVGKPKKFPVKWKADQLEMSDDTSINFFRLGSLDLTIKNESFAQSGQPVKWNIMLKGPRMGYTNFSIISSPSTQMHPKYTIDSLFGKNIFKAKVLKTCDAKELSGYHYYEVKLPKKDIAFIKFSWMSVNGNTAIRIDCFDNWSKYAVKLECK